MSDYSKSIVIIPTLNEKENLKELIPQIFGLMPDISVLIVDDNSKDGTRELVGSLTERFKGLFILNRLSSFGYGRSSIDGFKWVLGKEYENLVTMDADFSHDPNSIPAMIEMLNLSDITVGSRYVRGGGVKNWNFFRKVLSKFANFYVRLILGLPVSDATSGFNSYRVSALKKINFDEIRSEGYAFLVELKYQLFRAGCRFSEHPIIFSERREGQSKMSSKIIWESVLLPWKLRS